MRKNIFISMLVLSFSVGAMAAKVAKGNQDGNSKVPWEKLEAPQGASLNLLIQADPEEIATKPVDEKKRVPATQSEKRIIGSQEMMSDALKSFRDQLISQKEAEHLDALLKKYDETYDSHPSDLKYVIARLSPLRAFRGFIWRMLPLAHQSVMSQEMLVTTVRAFAEQVMVFEPNTHWQAYMAFLTIPTARLMQPIAETADTRKRPNHQFRVEQDLVRFLVAEVYPALDTAVARLGKINTLDGGNPIAGKKSGAPIVFDNQIRFGPEAGGNDFAAVDRYSIIGAAEKFAAMARFNRRMSTIMQIGAYNWNGYINLRKEIGKKFGIDATLALTDDPFSVDGVTRAERVAIVKKATNNGRGPLMSLKNPVMMKQAFTHFRNYAYYIKEAWGVIKATDRDYDTLLDPDLFMGRKSQIDTAVTNLWNIVEGNEIIGSITGAKVTVKLKNFFDNPPSNVFHMMPTAFNGHQDIQKLVPMYEQAETRKLMKVDKVTLNPVDGSSRVKMIINGQKTEWRNYLYGRAIDWNPTEYGKLFAEVGSGSMNTAEAIRILGETRGSRPLLNGLLTFVK